MVQKQRTEGGSEESQESKVWDLIWGHPPFPSCALWGSAPSLSEPQSPHCKMEQKMLTQGPHLACFLSHHHLGTSKIYYPHGSQRGLSFIFFLSIQEKSISFLNR